MWYYGSKHTLRAADEEKLESMGSSEIVYFLLPYLFA
jgi:hypothetical protein